MTSTLTKMKSNSALKIENIKKKITGNTNKSDDKKKQQFKHLEMWQNMINALGSEIPLTIQTIRLNRLGTLKEKCFAFSGCTLVNWLTEYLRENHPHKSERSNVVKLCDVLHYKEYIKRIELRKLVNHNNIDERIGDHTNNHITQSHVHEHIFQDSKNQYYELGDQLKYCLEKRADINFADLQILTTTSSFKKKCSIIRRGSILPLMALDEKVKSDSIVESVNKHGDSVNSIDSDTNTSYDSIIVIAQRSTHELSVNEDNRSNENKRGKREDDDSDCVSV
eukprot:Pgem_evm1s7182